MIVGAVQAMARPRRPRKEQEMLQAAVADLGLRHGSIDRAAVLIASRVTAELMAYLDLDLADPVIAAMAKLIDTSSPIVRLARCPDIDSAELALEQRRMRFDARGCRQLTAAAWSEETREITAEVQRRLARRYAKLMRAESFPKPVLGNLGPASLSATSEEIDR